MTLFKCINKNIKFNDGKNLKFNWSLRKCKKNVKFIIMNFVLIQKINYFTSKKFALLYITKSSKLIKK